jgi:fructokinase
VIPARIAGQPLLFGELLFDNLPDGSRVLGGAPANIAWHLAAFGLNPLLVSRVGNDEAGEAIRRQLADWGVGIYAVQVDAQRPTGHADIVLDSEGKATFSLPLGQAWDAIDAAPLLPLLTRHHPALLYHGTLPLRDHPSSAAWQALDQLAIPRFVDLNLRAPWYQAERLPHLLQGATWVKMSSEELKIVAGDASWQTAEALRRHYGWRLLLVTCGEQGAWWISGEESLRGEARKVKVIDTVGAGDAFCSVVIYGLLRGWSAVTILQRAIDFSAQICEVAGATLSTHLAYDNWLIQWQDRVSDR